MRNALVVVGLSATLAALVATYLDDPRAVTRMDRQIMGAELARASLETTLVTTAGPIPELDALVAAARAKNPDHVVLGASPDTTRVSIPLARRAHFDGAELEALSGGWTRGFTELGNGTGAARALVHQYVALLEKKGLTRPGERGVLAPFLPPDPGYFERAIYRSFGAGLLLLVATIAFALAYRDLLRSKHSADA